MIKCVFLAKEDWQETDGSNKESETGKLRLVSYAREEMHDFIQMLKERCYIRRKSDEDRPVMYSTGTLHCTLFSYGMPVARSLGKSRSRDGKTELLFIEGAPIEIHQ